MVHEFHADLHVHTCLSPCGELSMSPAGIVEAARAKGINVLGVCDHNSARNAPYVVRAARGSGVVILPGMEVCSREEVHVVTLFETTEAALAMQETVYAALEGKNNPGVFGMQVVANELGEVEDFEERLLIGATTLSIDAIAARVRELGGLVIPAHIDRQAYGLVGQLGFIPPGLDADALEISYRIKAAQARATIPGTEAFPLVTGSDAHDLPDLGRAVTRFHLETRTLAEIRMALRGEGGRRVEID
jgi:PHP family Zn ribbon phosphoesterase